MGTQQFCLRWNNHQSNMLNVFDQLLRNEAFVDVTLACEGVSVKAHKMVLSACSPYFQNLFLENPCQHPIVILKDMKYSELRAIIDFMYKGEINVSQDQLSALLKTAETLKVKGLAEVSTGNVPNSGVEVPSLDDSGVSPGGSTGPGGGSSAGGGSGGGGGGSSAGSGALSCASGSGVGVGSGSGVSMAPGSPTGDGRSSPPAKRKRHRQGRRPSNGDVSDTGERSGDQQFDAEALARLKSEPLEPAAETHVEVVMEPPSQQYDPEVPSSLERCLSEAREREISLIPRSDGITTGSTSGHGNIGQPQPSTSGTSQASQDLLPKGSRPGRGRYRRGLDATYDLALADVREGRLSYRRAAEVYGVPLTTLFGRGKAQGICSARRRGPKVITDAEILHWAAASIMYDRPGGTTNIVGSAAAGGGRRNTSGGGGGMTGPDVDVDVEDMEDEDDEDEDLERATRRRIMMMMMGGEFGSSGTQSGPGPSSEGHGKGVRGRPVARLAAELALAADDDDDDEDVDVVMEHDALIDKYERALEEVRCGSSFQKAAARYALPVMTLSDMGKARGVGGPMVQRKKTKAVRRKKKKVYQRQQKQPSASTSEAPQNDVPTEQDELVVAELKEDGNSNDEVPKVAAHSDVKQEVPEMSPEDAELDVSIQQELETEEIASVETGKEVIGDN